MLNTIEKKTLKLIYSIITILRRRVTSYAVLACNTVKSAALTIVFRGGARGNMPL